MIALGDLSRAAHLTDAMVLISFICVNLGLTWLGLRNSMGAVATRRGLDIVVSALGALMCGWLLWHGGWVWIVAASGVGLFGVGAVVLGRAVASRARGSAAAGG